MLNSQPAPAPGGVCVGGGGESCHFGDKPGKKSWGGGGGGRDGPEGVEGGELGGAEEEEEEEAARAGGRRAAPSRAEPSRGARVAGTARGGARSGAEDARPRGGGGDAPEGTRGTGRERGARARCAQEGEVAPGGAVGKFGALLGVSGFFGGFCFYLGGCWRTLCSGSGFLFWGFKALGV